LAFIDDAGRSVTAPYVRFTYKIRKEKFKYATAH